MIVENARVRFAPSPTGNLHIGGLRAAIFNWLFAHHHKGTFVIRIEDTDRARSTQEYTDSIIDSLAWMQIKSDEPLHIQSEFESKHKEYLQQLLSEGKAYKCYCSTEELESRLDTNQKYDLCCRDKECPDLEERPYVVRFKVPESIERLTFTDLIRGEITFERDQLDDFIIARSDGTPVYNFVVVIDDAEMKINYVIRGEEHLGNTPKQILLYNALGFDEPQWAHLPLILSPNGGKLSKRDGAVSVLEYKKDGYLPDALLNYLVRLGWSHGDQEVFTRQELVDLFTLEAVGKSGAAFDVEKLDWLNGLFIRNMTAKAILDYIQTTMGLDLNFANWSQEQVVALINLYKERAKTVMELVNELSLLYQAPVEYDAELTAKWITPDASVHLQKTIELLATLPSWDADMIKQEVGGYCKSVGIKLPQLLQPIRIGLIGKIQSPSAFQLIALLGKDETVKRLESLISRMS